MKRGTLIELCEEIIKTFNPKVMTLDSHAAEQLGDADSDDANPDCVFIKQVFYGCVRNKQALKAFLSQFYNAMAAKVLRADYTLYLIITYLTYFRLEELGWHEYRRFIESQEPDKMAVFLSFAFDVKGIEGSVKWDWMKVFDMPYIDKEMMGPIRMHAPKVRDMVAQLSHLANGLAAEREAANNGTAGVKELPKRKGTVPVSPRLTKPALRQVPMPQKIVQKVPIGKDPIYMERNSLEKIENENVKRLNETREATRRKYEDSSVKPFNLHTTRRTLPGARKKKEAEDQELLQFSGDTTKRGDTARMEEGGNTQRRTTATKPRPSTYRRPDPGKAPIKMNAAAYLREDALYKRKQEQEVKMIQAYEAELRDSTEYYRWQNDMKAKDVQDRLDQVERVRMVAKLSAQEAKEAMEKQKLNNAEMAYHVKREGDEMGKQRALEEEMRKMMNQQLVKEVAHVRTHAPRIAEARVLEERKERRGKVRDEMAKLIAEKEVEEKRELELRQDRVKQLRALAEVHPEYVKVFDPTESAGIGLLDEMSLVEMKERLIINKLRDDEEQKRKRVEIIESKNKKHENLRKRIENIERVRGAAAEANREARIKAKREEVERARRAETVRNEKNLVLVQQLNAKQRARKDELRQLREEEERRRNAQAFSGQGSEAAEETHFDDLMAGAEREITRRQEEAKAVVQKYEGTKAVARAAVVAGTKKRERRKQRLYAQQADEIERKRKEQVDKEKSDILRKKATFQTHREKQKRAKEKIIALNPYAESIVQMSRSKRMEAQGAV